LFGRDLKINEGEISFLGLVGHKNAIGWFLAGGFIFDWFGLFFKFHSIINQMLHIYHSYSLFKI